MRLNTALSDDKHRADEDATYLYDLQRNLQTIEAEHQRRAELTPDQQAREAASRTQTTTRNPAHQQGAPSSGPTPETPYRAPDLGKSQGYGPGL
ncbi:hypothetical protein [Nocardia tengchongensis]|uniref:hypothetical protein n=1 Tax=Nocardia tengchongensis TaxID=2055889 RepID=UPI00366A53BB